MAWKTKESFWKYYQEFKNKCFDIIGRTCAVCGSLEDLEIDHIDWRTKTINISKHMSPKWWAIVVEELRKCQPLCGKCHKEKSAKDIREKCTKPLKHGTPYGYKRGCRCTECVYAQSKYKITWLTLKGYTGAGKIRGRYSRSPICGTTARYSRGCRCDECRKANTEKAKRNRIKNASAGRLA